jgi:hypothetical protein
VEEFGEKQREKQRRWLAWSVTRAKGAWSTSLRKKPAQYKLWLLILHHIASSLNLKKRPCPHPRMFTKSGLREKNVWYTADVEMALFAYASSPNRREKRG